MNSNLWYKVFTLGFPNIEAKNEINNIFDSLN